MKRKRKHKRRSPLTDADIAKDRDEARRHSRRVRIFRAKGIDIEAEPVDPTKSPDPLIRLAALMDQLTQLGQMLEHDSSSTAA